MHIKKFTHGANWVILGLRLDGLSIPFALTIYILSTVVALYSKPYMVRKILREHENIKSGINSKIDSVEDEGHKTGENDNGDVSTLVLSDTSKILFKWSNGDLLCSLSGISQWGC